MSQPIPSIPIATFVHDRIRDIEEVIPFLQDHHRHHHSNDNENENNKNRNENENENEKKKKRKFSSIFYRTRSYRTYKKHRREKEGNNGKTSSSNSNRKLLEKKQKMKKKLKLYRVHNRRPSLLTTTFQHYHRLPSANTPLSHLMGEEASPPLQQQKTHGFYIAEKSQNKGLKTLEKLLKMKNCFLHDRSYFRPIEMKGVLPHVIAILENLLDPSDDLLDLLRSLNLQFAAREVISLFYHPYSFPRDALGPIEVTIRVDYDQSKGDDLHVQLLLWTHPTLLQTLSEALNTVKEDQGSSSSSSSPSLVQVGLFEVPLTRLTLYSERARDVLLNSIRPSLSSPLDQKRGQFFQESLQSLTRLRNVWKNGFLLALNIHPPTLVQEANGSSMDEKEEEGGDSHERKPSSIKLTWPNRASQSSLWSKTGEEDPPNDSREINKLPLRLSLDRQMNIRKYQNEIAAWSTIDTLWSDGEQLKQQLQSNKMVMAVDRSRVTAVMRHLFPKDTTSASSTTSTIPILVIQRHAVNQSYTLLDNGRQSTTLSFDIITSYEHVTSLLHHIIRQGQRQGQGQTTLLGSEEVSFLNVKHHQLSFPQDYLDTSAGWEYWTNRFKQYQTLLRLRPPSKRFLKCYHRRSLVHSYAGFYMIRRWLKYYEAQYVACREEEEEVEMQQEDEKNNNPPHGSSDEEVNKEEEVEVEEEMDNKVNSTIPSFVVIRNQLYLSSFLPPLPSHNNNNNNSEEEEENEKAGLPTLPQLTMIHVQLRPISKGLPHTAALILLPLESDYNDLVTLYDLHINPPERKKTLSYHVVTPLDGGKLSSSWSGVKLDQSTLRYLSKQARSCYESSDEMMMIEKVAGRQVLGFVTTGAPPHTNHVNKFMNNDKLGFLSIGLAHASLLYDHLAESSRSRNRERNDFVFFWNVGSHWLRPGIVKFL
eukprot:scaffold1172_cov180-Ochromonas_danica.AAC.31